MIDYSKIAKQAKRMDISSYQLVKRQVGFRKKLKCESGCHECYYISFIKYKPPEVTANCKIIGESIEKEALVSRHSVCSEWRSINK